MPKKDETLLSLPPFTAPPGGNAQSSLVTYKPSAQIIRDERRIQEELQRQTLVQSGQALKTVFGVTKIAELHLHGVTSFDETVHFIETLREGQKRGTQHQRYLDEFSAHQVQMLAQHLTGAIATGAYHIAGEINRSLYPQPEKPRGFWQRLMGGDEE